MVQYTTNVMFWNGILHILLKYYPENKTCYTDKKSDQYAGVLLLILAFKCSSLRVSDEGKYRKALRTHGINNLFGSFLILGRIFQEVVDILIGTNDHKCLPLLTFCYFHMSL